MLRRVGAGVRSTQGFDLGYLVHWQLVTLFGDAAPRTFAIQSEDGPWIDVLGYFEGEVDAMHAARAGADPAAVAACDWPAFGARPMPPAWRSGVRLDFETRVCPVVRRPRGTPHGRKGAEVDAFLAACDGAGGAPVDRMTVYRGWIAKQFERDGAAVLSRFDAVAFRRAVLHRRTQGDARRAQSLERPDLTATGTIEVGSPEAFDRLVRRGLGRHRAFGFGMLLLRPAS